MTLFDICKNIHAKSDNNLFQFVKFEKTTIREKKLVELEGIKQKDTSSQNKLNEFDYSFEVGV